MTEHATEQTVTNVTAHAPEDADTTTPPPGTPDAKEGNAEAAKYRTRLRAAEAERDTLAERITAMQLAEASRLAGERLADGTDVITFTDGGLAALLDDDGALDPAKVADAIEAVIAKRPGLQHQPKWSGVGQGGTRYPRTSEDWSEVIRGA